MKYFTVNLDDNNMLVAIPCRTLPLLPWVNGLRFLLDDQFKNICKQLNVLPKHLHQNPVDPINQLLDIKLLTSYDSSKMQWEDDIFAIEVVKNVEVENGSINENLGNG